MGDGIVNEFLIGTDRLLDAHVGNCPVYTRTVEAGIEDQYENIDINRIC